MTRLSECDITVTPWHYAVTGNNIINNLEQLACIILMFDHAGFLTCRRTERHHPYINTLSHVAMEDDRLTRGPPKLPTMPCYKISCIRSPWRPKLINYLGKSVFPKMVSSQLLLWKLLWIVLNHPPKDTLIESSSSVI